MVIIKCGGEKKTAKRENPLLMADDSTTIIIITRHTTSRHLPSYAIVSHGMEPTATKNNDNRNNVSFHLPLILFFCTSVHDTAPSLPRDRKKMGN